MNTPQLHGKRLRHAQETGNEKVESLLSIHQTLIDHSMDVMIDSSKFVVDNGNSPVGSIEDIFTRLTQRMIFEFLGGHARMEELPCLGDLEDGNDEFHRITSFPTFSKSSQFKLLDSTGNLHLSSIAFIDSDFNPRTEDYLCESVLLDSFDASSTKFISSFGHFQSKLISQSADHTIEESLQCSTINKVVEEGIAGLMAESSCHSDFFESQVFMESDEFPFGMDFISAPIPISSNQSNKEHPESSVSIMAHPKDDPNILDMNKILPSEIYKASINVSIIHSTSNGDSVSSMDCIQLGGPCNDKFGDSNNLATISTDESVSKFLIPDPKHLNEFLYGNLKFPMFLASELPDENLDTFDYPSLHEGSDLVDSSDVADQSDNKFNDHFNHCVCNYDKKTSDTSGVLIGLENGSSSGECKEMEVSVTLKILDPCYTEPLDTHWPTLVNLSSFDVSDHEELLESYGFNNKDEYNEIGYTCTSPTWPGKMTTAWKETIQMNLTDLASNKDPLSSFYDEIFKNSVSSTDLKQMKCAFNTSSSPYSSEDYFSQGHMSDDGFGNSIEEPISGNTEKSLVYAIPDPDTLNEYLYGSLNSPVFLASELMNTNFDKHDSLSIYGDRYSDNCADVANSSDNCNVGLLDSNSSSKDPVAFPFDFNDQYELLETYGMNIQEQYTNTYTCPSPTWPEKMIVVSKGQIQTGLVPNLTEDETADGLVTADSSLFYSNTDETSVMNKNWTDKIHEENSENSVSLCHLNQMECVFETSRIDAGLLDCAPPLHSCSDGFEDSIEHQSLKNDFKFAFPDPSTLRDFLFGSLDSPRFLASELLDGKVDNFLYPSLFRGCEQNDRTEEADPSDKMILYQLCEAFSKDDNSINKFSRTIEFLDVNSSSFDISDHDEVMEWYGINDQDQFMDGNWICDSPTWPGKI